MSKPKNLYTQDAVDLGKDADVLFNLQMTLPPYIVSIKQESKTIVSITKDGNVELGEGITPSDASLTFWKTIAAIGPMESNSKMNGLTIAQSKLYAIGKIYDLLVKGEYEVAKNVAEVALKHGEKNVST